VLTKKWTDWVDYWAVDFNYESRKEIIKVPKRMGVEGELPGAIQADKGEFVDFEERWTGAYIFENEWQSFRTRQSRDLELTSVSHTFANPGRYTVAVEGDRYFRQRHHDPRAGDGGVTGSNRPLAVAWKALYSNG
jgi:site-specific DNA-methyltransferase (adenine-specific)/adenine-specific DNA-methyltransferase